MIKEEYSLIMGSRGKIIPPAINIPEERIAVSLFIFPDLYMKKVPIGPITANINAIANSFIVK